jgi:hypothetical protein
VSVDTGEIIATVAVGLAGASLLVSAWSATTAHRARAWQQKRDRERLETRVKVAVRWSRLYTERGPRIDVKVLVFNHGENVEYVQHVRVQAMGRNAQGIVNVHHIAPIQPPPRDEVAEELNRGLDPEPPPREEWPRPVAPRSSTTFDVSLPDARWVASA